MHQERHYANTLPPAPQSLPRLTQWIEATAVPTLAQRVVSRVRTDDLSVYTGLAGAALLLVRLHESREFAELQLLFANEAHTPLALARRFAEHVLAGIRGPDEIDEGHAGFLCTDVGSKAVAAVVLSYFAADEPEAAETLDALSSEIAGAYFRETTSSDVMHGRAGYLYALGFLGWGTRGRARTSAEHVRAVVADILAAAEPVLGLLDLAWPWHGMCYLGAAHGAAGVLKVLLDFDEMLSEDERERVLHAVDQLAGLRVSSDDRNYPTSLWKRDGRRSLVQWCHGAPGFALLYAKAYARTRDSRYLSLLRECADVTWERGLLKKGVGLCHGLAGNGYALLAAGQFDKAALGRAFAFAEWAMALGDVGVDELAERADNPWSLYEGMAGLACFLLDVLAAARGGQVRGLPGFDDL